MNEYLDISDEVREALSDGRPIVALESTIISHGMPYPENRETALSVERTVRENGATPATIAVLGGRLKTGLTAAEIELLARKGREATKVSRRDLPFVIARRGDGATTVAGTMIVASMAGIRVFATGGIGGVHRGAERSFDVSADLEELAGTEVAVVCAGAKSILDLGLTLEYLETRGVPVVGYGTDELPAFYTRSSGFKLDYRLDSPEEVASMLRAKWRAGLGGGAIIANPIPADHAMDPAVVNRAIDQALREAAERQVKGKEMTPFLLGRIVELTGGDSLESNIALVLNNAALAARIAVAYVVAGNGRPKGEVSRTV